MPPRALHPPPEGRIRRRLRPWICVIEPDPWGSHLITPGPCSSGNRSDRPKTPMRPSRPLAAALVALVALVLMFGIGALWSLRPTAESAKVPTTADSDPREELVPGLADLQGSDGARTSRIGTASESEGTSPSEPEAPPTTSEFEFRRVQDLGHLLGRREIRVEAPPWHPLDTGFRETLASGDRAAWLLSRRRGGGAVLVNAGMVLDGELDLVPPPAPIRIRFEPSTLGVPPHEVGAGTYEHLARLENDRLVAVEVLEVGQRIEAHGTAPFEDQVELAGLHAGVEYWVSVHSSDRSVTGSQVRIDPIQAAAPADLVVQWRDSPQLQVIVESDPRASGTAYYRPQSRPSDNSPLFEIIEGRGSRESRNLRDGDYQVVAVGPGWVSENPPPSFTIRDGIAQPAVLYLEAVQVEEATLEFVGDPRARRSGRLSYLTEEGRLWRIQSFPHTNRPCTAHWVESTLHLVGLEGPIDILWRNENSSVTVFRSLGPGDALSLDVSSPPKRIFRGAMDAARAMKLEDPDLDYVRLHIEVDCGEAGLRWFQVMDRPLSKSFAFENTQWVLSVNPKARYRLCAVGDDPETSGVDIPHD